MAFIEVNQVQAGGKTMTGVINTDHVVSVTSGTQNRSEIQLVGMVRINLQESYDQMKKLLGV
jgi:hypothetical protein